MIDLADYASNLLKKDGILFPEVSTAISYPKTGNSFCHQLEETSFWFNHRNNCIAASVKKHLSGKLFFDVGGGNGFVSAALQQHGLETVLIEPGIAGCINAKKYGVKHVICSTLEHAAFKTNSLPAVGLFDVIEHIANDASFLQSIFGYLEPGGVLFVTAPAYSLLWSADDDKAGHFRRYTIRSLKKKLQIAGFEIDYSTYIFSILPPIIFLLRTIPFKLGIKQSPRQKRRYKREHEVKSGLVQKILASIWKIELNIIKQGRKISFGGSCLLVARKSR
jgi:SAM-dependent methyltransferase